MKLNQTKPNLVSQLIMGLKNSSDGYGHCRYTGCFHKIWQSM